MPSSFEALLKIGEITKKADALYLSVAGIRFLCVCDLFWWIWEAAE
jgi:hypothetical protein